MFLLGMCLGFTHLCQDVGQLFTLPLGTDVCAQTTFQELQCTLVLRHFQQFHGALLVRCMTAYLADKFTHELGVFSLDRSDVGRHLGYRCT